MAAARNSPSSNAKTQAYGESWYWDNRYTRDPSSFDWYQKYSALAPIIRLYVPNRRPVLVVGCGNSGFTEGMADDGYDQLVNIDISKVVIEAMQKKYSSRPQLKYMNMDARDMSALSAGSFAAVIDKGTLDSILCGHSSQENSSKMLQEVWRVLDDDGVYILITYGSPSFRLPLLAALPWTVKLHLIEKLPSRNGSHCCENLTTPVPLHGDSPEVVTQVISGAVHYIYVCFKKMSPLQSDA